MNNTIILLKGEERLTDSELKRFSKCDTILGCDSNPVEIKRWSMDQIDEAKAELEKYRCEYDGGYITEYALEYCECDEDGEFVCGSDYDFAKNVNGEDEDYLSVGKVVLENRDSFDNFEIWQFTDKTRRLHTDFIKNLDEYYTSKVYGKLPVKEYHLMDEQEYNDTILCNSSVQADFDELYGNSYEKVLVIMIDYDVVIE